MKLLLLCLVVGYFTSPNKAQIRIKTVFNDASIEANKWYVSANGDSLQLETVRFYLSDIQLENKDGQRFTDTQKAHLIDVFDTSTLIIPLPTIDWSSVKALHFQLGLDSLTNASGALSGDLDPTKGMYWAWQSGFIHLKIEGKSPQSRQRKQRFEFHIGGYLFPFSTVREIILPVISTNKAVFYLKIDLARWFDTFHLTTQKNIMLPCRAAQIMADEGVKMFSIDTHEK
jgi:hypothetical protein